MERTKCPECGAEIDESSKFCSECGFKLPAAKLDSPARCPNPTCGQVLEGQEKFCPSCGAQIEDKALGQSGTLIQPKAYQAQKISCNDCTNFRDVRPISDFLVRGGSAQASQAITKIKEDETKQRIAEAKQKIELIKVQRKEWGFRPIMSDFCVAKAESQVYEICELKNKDGDCADFQERHIDYSRTCASCIHEVFVNPQKNFEVLKGIHDPKIHHGMMEGIQAEEAEEITSLYFSKGESIGEPRFHSWCRYYSTGKYIALPYPNVHNDCPHHGLKPDYKPILDSMQDMGSELPYQAEERLEVVAIQSQYMVANRSGNRESLISFFTRQFERIQKGELQAPLSEHFQNWAFITLQMIGSTQEGGRVTQPLADYFPERLKQLQGDETRLKSIIQDVEKNNLFFKLINESPYALINAVAQEVSEDRLRQICLQTIREGYNWGSGLSITSRLRWLAEEETRIENGLYPEGIVVDLMRLIKKFKLNISKLKTQLEKAGKEAEARSYVLSMAPLSVPEVIEIISRQAAVWSIPPPFSLVPLSEEQQRIIIAIAQGDYNCEEAVVFIEDQYDQLCKAYNSFWQSAEQEDANMDGFGNLKHLGPTIAQIFGEALPGLWGYLNFLSRKLRPREHKDYDFCINDPQIIKAWNEKLDVDVRAIFFPEVESLYLIKYGHEKNVLESPKQVQGGQKTTYPGSAEGVKDVESKDFDIQQMDFSMFSLQSMVDDVRKAIEERDQQSFEISDAVFRARLRQEANLSNKIGLEWSDLDELVTPNIIRILVDEGLVH